MKWPQIFRARYPNGRIHSRYLGIIAWGPKNQKRRTLSELVQLRDQIDMILQQESDADVEAGIIDHLEGMLAIIKNRNNSMSHRISYLIKGTVRLENELRSMDRIFGQTEVG